MKKMSFAFPDKKGQPGGAMHAHYLSTQEAEARVVPWARSQPAWATSWDPIPSIWKGKKMFGVIYITNSGNKILTCQVIII